MGYFVYYSLIVFIRALRQKSFPYRCGSAANSVGSDLKRYFAFILSSVLHNTFAIYEHYNGITTAAAAVAASEEEEEKGQTQQFSSHCVHLVEELFDSTL